MLYAAQRVLMDLSGPPSVVVNAEGDIIYINGRTGKYLEPASGNILATVREPLVVQDGALRIVSATPSFYQLVQTQPVETEGRLFDDLGQRQWEVPGLRQLLEEILLTSAPLEDFRVAYESSLIGAKCCCSMPAPSPGQAHNRV